MEQLQQGADVFFLLMGAILVFAMHGGFAFLEVGTVRHKNQVNALCKILVDFAISTVAYFFIGYWIAYGVSFLSSAEAISRRRQGLRRRRACRWSSSSSWRRSRPPCRRSSRAASPSGRSFVPQCVGDGADRRPRSTRSSKASSGTRTSACRRRFFAASARRRVQGLRRLDRRARRSAAGRRWPPSPARAAARPLRQGPLDRHAAVVDPVARHGLVDAVHRLVRLQRDERAER